MEEKRASRTALFSAYLRGHHGEHVNSKIFNDCIANELLTAEERSSFDKFVLSGLMAYDPKLASSFPNEATALAFTMQIIPGPPQILSRARFTEALDPGKAAPRIQGMIYGTKQMNEPIKTGFNPDTLEEELNKISLHLLADLSPAELQSRYFQGRSDKYYALE